MKGRRGGVGGEGGNKQSFCPQVIAAIRSPPLDPRRATRVSIHTSDGMGWV